ncbi:MAG: alpha/beta hydrolase [Mariniblastus sp.]|nr:alpha/beta hydrolase [Mariniblastus sp.]
MRHISANRLAVQLTSFLLLLLLTGCLGPTHSRRLMPTPIGITTGLPYPGSMAAESWQNVEETVPVFVVSGRNVDPDKTGLDPFGTQRSHRPRMGIAQVKIGAGLSPDQLRQETVTRRDKKEAKVEFSEIELTPWSADVSPWRVKDEVVRHGDHPWVKAVKQQLERTGSRQATIFVHGYNTDFIDNTMLAAEIYHYLGRRGAMISFEWPSEAKLLGYMADKGNATYSTRHFRALVSNLAKECDIDSITIIAHSAGSPIVVNALREIRLLEFELTPEEIREKYAVHNVVLAAPDMDMMAFINAVYDRFYEVSGQVAVYASTRDRALEMSQWIYGNARLGRAVDRLEPWESQTLMRVPEIQMIDASEAEERHKNFLGHGYFHRDPWVSSDIGAFILGRTPAERGLARNANGVFWEFPRDFPERLAELAEMRRRTEVITTANFRDEPLANETNLTR